ncbi:uncharacterized protein LOC110914242 [Helianthus annuus]|uniref:uncharacterized protein LOC110914242 n=1 Tax=Helianthus annuus TaxID=4232 RepID=UPI000B905B29|nr:uncharacterized protein LOC110914242 [Helianthus annuus]
MRDKSHEVLAKQVEQLAKEVAQMRGNVGKLPSDTTMNQKHQSSSTSNERNVHISAVSLLPNDEICGVQSIPLPQFVDGVVEDVSDEPESENEQKMISQTKTENITKNSFCENCLNELKPINASKVEERYPPKDKRWENFKQAKINLPLLDNIKKVPAHEECLKELSIEKRHNKLPEPVDLISYVSAVLSSALPQKAQDPGDPLILIQIGTFKINRALLDLGACVSILPGSLYDQYDFGPLKKFGTPVVLADQTPTHPRGMVEDVIVKVDDCYYPVDFLVVDYVRCVEDTQPIVILGIPFLATANAIINCATRTVSMKFGDRELNLNVFSNFTNPLGEDKCPKKDMNPNKKVCAMVGRFGETKKKTVKKKKAKKSPQEKKKEEEVRKFGPFGNNWYESPVGDFEEFVGGKHAIVRYSAL